MQEQKAREQEVAANLLKRFEPQGATMVMVEAALSAAEGSTRIAIKMLTAQLARCFTDVKTTYSAHAMPATAVRPQVSLVQAAMCANACMHACAHWRTCVCTRTRTSWHWWMDTQISGIDWRVYPSVCTCARTHTCTHAHTHARTCAHYHA